MVRKLKFHEQKLLKKVDFINWDTDTSQHENKIMRLYHVEKREHYTLYNKLSREVWSFKGKENFKKEIFAINILPTAFPIIFSFRLVIRLLIYPKT